MECRFHRPPALLHEDLLHEIFGYISCPSTLACASIVCCSWTSPAQAALYRNLEYSPLSRCARQAQLACTLRTRPHLLRFVRCLSLTTTWTHSPTPELCEWMEHIPEHCLQVFRWIWERGHPLPWLLTFPAVRTARRIELKGKLYTMDTLQEILELPSVSSLTLELKGDEEGSLALTRSRLRHLSVTAHDGHSQTLDNLLAAVGPQIESLHVNGKLGDDPQKDSALVACIHTHCPDLKRLDIETITPPKAPIPLADALVRQYQSLEYLRCGQGVFSEDLFQHIPPSLRVLKFAFAPSHEIPLVSFLEKVGSRRGSLSSLELLGDCNPDLFAHLTAQCHVRGIDVRVHHTTSRPQNPHSVPYFAVKWPSLTELLQVALYGLLDELLMLEFSLAI
ncbi:hypothetical protein BD414DRAFT_458913 [Trametes punicea]|nr:hypothetical protein BD414DRAFT_458913 [Trametes punicea]